MPDADPFPALADPTRRALLELLAERPRPVGELADRFPVSRPAISKHLKVLREAGLVEEERQGRERIYSLLPEGLEAARRWLVRLEAGRRPQRPAASPAPPSWRVW